MLNMLDLTPTTVHFGSTSDKNTCEGVKCSYSLRLQTGQFLDRVWRTEASVQGWKLNLFHSIIYKFVVYLEYVLMISCCGQFYLAFSLFSLLSDNGDAQIKHLITILSAVVLWIEPPDVIAASIRNGGSERSCQDPCLQCLRKKLRNTDDYDSPVLQWVYRWLPCATFNGFLDYWLTFWQPPKVNKVSFVDCGIVSSSTLQLRQLFGN